MLKVLTYSSVEFLIALLKKFFEDKLWFLFIFIIVFKIAIKIAFFGVTKNYFLW